MQEIGQYAAGQFTVDEPLPYTAKVMRVDANGIHHVFADTFQGASTVIIFEKNRMYLSIFAKSYSTGDYHAPDGTIYEIEYLGQADGKPTIGRELTFSAIGPAQAKAAA